MFEYVSSKIRQKWKSEAHFSNFYPTFCLIFATCVVALLMQLDFLCGSFVPYGNSLFDIVMANHGLFSQFIDQLNFKQWVDCVLRIRTQGLIQ